MVSLSEDPKLLESRLDEMAVRNEVRGYSRV